MESKKWCPRKWTDKGIEYRIKRIYRYALQDLSLMVGDHRARLIYAEEMAKIKSEQSRVQLTRLGIPLIGSDTGALF